MRGCRGWGRVRLISRSGAHDADFRLELFVVSVTKDLFNMNAAGGKIECIIGHGVSGKPILPVDLLVTVRLVLRNRIRHRVKGDSSKLPAPTPPYKGGEPMHQFPSSLRMGSSGEHGGAEQTTHY